MRSNLGGAKREFKFYIHKYLYYISQKNYVIFFLIRFWEVDTKDLELTVINVGI